MTEAVAWNDEARENLRDMLRWVILGNLRLARHDREEILEICCDGYLADECPADEFDAFRQFAIAELDRVASQLESEKATWPAETDCDRLDRVEDDLRERGILFWQVSPCCDTCTIGEMPGRIAEIADRYPGFRKRLRGYAFFIDQTMPESLSDDTQIDVYLAYGWLTPDDSTVAPDVYEANALGIAQEVCQVLRDHGFEVDWNGSFDRKIRLALNWQRRTLLA